MVLIFKGSKMGIEQRIEEIENTLAKVVNCQDTQAAQIGIITKMLEEVRDCFKE